MEWAVGKQGEIMRPNTGKLMLPGSQDRLGHPLLHGGEDITDAVELGIYFYPKGQEPKYRQTLHLMGAPSGGVDIPPNAIKATQGFFVMRRAGRVESFQPHMHLRGKAMSMEAILPNGQTADPEPRGRLQLQLAQLVRLRRRRGAAAAEGHDPQGHGVARQHGRRRRATPTRTSGSATAIARSTRWRTRGSTSRTSPTRTISPRSKRGRAKIARTTQQQQQ